MGKDGDYCNHKNNFLNCIASVSPSFYSTIKYCQQRKFQIQKYLFSIKHQLNYFLPDFIFSELYLADPGCGVVQVQGLISSDLVFPNWSLTVSVTAQAQGSPPIPRCLKLTLTLLNIAAPPRALHSTDLCTGHSSVYAIAVKV